MLICRIFGAPVTPDIFRRRYQFFGLVSSSETSFNGNPNRTVFLIVSFELKTVLKIYLRTSTCIVSAYCFNTIHAEISARCLAENTSVNPKQCRKIILSAKRCN